MFNFKIFIICFLITLVVTVLILKRLIPFLKSIKAGQKILDIGPKWHKPKEGTPTMCGASFIVSGIIAISTVLLIYFNKIQLNDIMLILNIFVFAILNALIGVIDDLAKLRKSKNEGLSAKAKLLFQSIVTILFLASLKFTVGINTILYIPYFNINIELGFFYYVISFLILCGMVNSVNLTDGIDGLASSVTLTVGLFLFFVAFTKAESIPLILISSLLIGSTIGFLFFNLHPAKCFMGDTGSLFLGAIVGASAFILDNPLLVLIYGCVFFLESISDIMQVIYFKITKGKRLFKMAPLHHHFEKCGFSEMKIVGVFSIVNIIFCIIAYFGLGRI